LAIIRLMSAQWPTLDQVPLTFALAATRNRKPQALARGFAPV
jgi:hypothetical protein